MSPLPLPVRLGLAMFLGLMLQLTIFNSFVFSDVSPNFMLVLPIGAALVGGAGLGAVVGFIAGLMIDLFATTPLGLTALVWTLMGYVVGVTHASLIRESRITVMGVAAVAASLAVVGFVIMGSLVGQDYLLRTSFLTIAVVDAITAALFVLVVTPLFRWVFGAEYGSISLHH